MSEITVSWAIMAHQKRADFIPELRTWLGTPDMPVVWDRWNDRWDTGKRSMEAFDPGCTHHAVIQDDVLPCKDLVTAMPKILAHVSPDAPLCGYVGRVRPSKEMVDKAAKEANRVGASFITMHTLNWGPLIVVPTAAIPVMLAYSDQLSEIPNYDRRLSRYWELEAKIGIWYAWPCLVDHRDGPSLVPGRMGTHHYHRSHADRRGSRVAHSFLGMDRSALDIDWSGPVVHEGGAREFRRFRHRETGQIVSTPAMGSRITRYTGNPVWEAL